MVCLTERNTKIIIRLCRVRILSYTRVLSTYPFLSVYRVSNESFTLDEFLRGDKETQKEVCRTHFYSYLMYLLFPEQLFQEWEISPEKARLSSNAIDAGFKVTNIHLLSSPCGVDSKRYRFVPPRRNSRRWAPSSTSSGTATSKTSPTSL
jgi:hypothetical protein